MCHHVSVGQVLSQDWNRWKTQHHGGIERFWNCYVFRMQHNFEGVYYTSVLLGSAILIKSSEDR